MLQSRRGGEALSNFNEVVDRSAGELILAIGQGTFRETLSRILNEVALETYNKTLARPPKEFNSNFSDEASNLGELKTLVDNLLCIFPADTPVVQRTSGSVTKFGDFHRGIEIQPTTVADKDTKLLDPYYYFEAEQGVEVLHVK